MSLPWVLSIAASWVLLLVETILLLLILRALGELRQKGQLRTADERIQSQGLGIGLPAPDFAALDLDGNTLNLTDFAGRWRLLTFISPGCPACVGTIDALNSFSRSGTSITILLVGGPDQDQNRAYAHEYQSRLPILTPSPAAAKEQYHLAGVPFSFL
ncbi:MAG: peroxiredoxin family protein, partial [Ktedonobacteraceae bacterium]